MDCGNDEKTTSLLKAAWLIAVITIFSKFIGFIRDIVIAAVYGASTVSDSYFYAYQIPSLALLLLGGVGGPFHSATVAVFSKLIPNLKDKPTEEINKLYSTFMTATVIFFVILGVIFFVFSHPIMNLIISEGSTQMVNLASMHLKIMTPIFVIGGICGIYYGILVTYKEFMLPNLSPIVMSLVIITMISLVHDDKTGIILAIATTVGAICQLALQYPRIKNLGFKVVPNLDINNPNFRNICELLFPAVLSSTVGQIHIYVDMFFTSSLREGAWTAIGYANRIFQFPVGILVVAFLVPLFPIFSRLVADKDMDGIRNYFNKGVSILFFGAIPIIIGILLLGYDGVSLIFEHGAFDSKATMMVTEALWCLSVSIIPYVFRDSITRVYYSFNDSKTPFIVAFSSVVLKVLLNFLFITKFGMGIGGITLSTSFVTLFNAVVLGYFIKSKIKLDYRELFKNLGKMLLAGGITFTICLVLCWGFSFIYLPKDIFALLKIFFVGIICVTVYVWLNLKFKMKYAEELLLRLVNKIKIKLGR